MTSLTEKAELRLTDVLWRCTILWVLQIYGVIVTRFVFMEYYKWHSKMKVVPD